MRSVAQGGFSTAQSNHCGFGDAKTLHNDTLGMSPSIYGELRDTTLISSRK